MDILKTTLKGDYRRVDRIRNTTRSSSRYRVTYNGYNPDCCTRSNIDKDADFETCNERSKRRQVDTNYV